VRQLVLRLGAADVSVPVDTVIVAGWTGRNREAVEEHIGELEALGVRRPSSVPVFYRVSATRLTTADVLEATDASSGEVEAVLLRHSGRIWVGVGSDHTDREVEKYGVAVAKQLCDKPIASAVWPLDQVAPHWDRLVLRSWIDDGVLYQEGSLDALVGAGALIESATPPLRDGTIMFCGTVPTIGGIRPAASFAYELADPVLGRSIRGAYAIRDLPLVT
jgi:Protein of unknown function (DUF2848)